MSAPIPKKTQGFVTRAFDEWPQEWPKSIATVNDAVTYARRWLALERPFPRDWLDAAFRIAQTDTRWGSGEPWQQLTEALKAELA